MQKAVELPGPISEKSQIREAELVEMNDQIDPVKNCCLRHKDVRKKRHTIIKDISGLWRKTGSLCLFLSEVNISQNTSDTVFELDPANSPKIGSVCRTLVRNLVVQKRPLHEEYYSKRLIAQINALCRKEKH